MSVNGSFQITDTYFTGPKLLFIHFFFFLTKKDFPPVKKVFLSGKQIKFKTISKISLVEKKKLKKACFSPVGLHFQNRGSTFLPKCLEAIQ